MEADAARGVHVEYRSTVTTPAPDAPSPTYARRLGLFSGTMLVVGGIIGSGIFLNPSIVARRTGSATLTMATWALGAVIALLGAFIFAELGRRRPEVGGGYAYLRDAFGPLPAFLYGWALLLAIATGAIAAVAVTFATYVAPIVGIAPNAVPLLAIAAVVVLSVVNVLGVQPGAATQNVFTLLKLAAIAALLLAAFGATPATIPTLPPPIATPPVAHPTTPLAILLAVCTALVPVLFSYGGWQQTNFVAGELRDPERTLPRALVLGVLIVVAVYLGANVAYLRTLGVVGLAASTAPAADTMAVAAGSAGRRLIAAGIAASTFGFLDLVILVSPRVYQAMAQDGLFFAGLARLHPRFRTPVLAIALQAAVAITLILTGSYGQLLDWVVFADWIFFGTTALTLVAFRRRDARSGVPEHGFRAPLYPVSVALFVLAAVYVVFGSIASNPGNALRGALLLAAGVPVFLYWRRKA
jgi:APA family basic amino acid/polyamine antiporter